jgi:uncharacterized protein (DUF2267 family)
MTVSAPVSHAVQTLQEWLKELKYKGDLADDAAAYSVLRSVLHQLRDRLTLEEGVDLGAQLPLIVRGRRRPRNRTLSGGIPVIKAIEAYQLSVPSNDQSKTGLYC